jgi:esterase/lipase
MKYLGFILVLLCFGCKGLSSQSQNEEFKKDQELIKVMSSFSNTAAKNEIAQSKADDKTKEVVTEAANTITSLKAEVAALKTELNEVKAQLNDTKLDTNSKFQLRPISNK